MSENKKSLAWTEVSCEHIVKDEWIDIRKVRYRFPDGQEFEPFYTYSRRNYVVIVAQDEEGNFLCVRQFRQGIRRVTVEFPAGGIERTDGKDYETYDPTREAVYKNEGSEDVLEAAKRELKEETGYQSDRWTHLITIPGNATIADNFAHVYLAQGCTKAGDLDLDETEFLEPEKYTADEIEAMIKDGTFAQAVHVMAWGLAKDAMREK